MNKYVVVGHFDDVMWKAVRYFKNEDANKLVSKLNKKYSGVATFEKMRVTCQVHGYENPCQVCLMTLEAQEGKD